MFRAIYLILCFNAFAVAEEPTDDIKWAWTDEGKLLTVFIGVDDEDDKEHVCILEMQDGKEVSRTLFDHPDRVFLSNPTIAVNQMGQATVAWTEMDCTSSICYASFYDGSWGAPTPISDPSQRVHTTPAITMDSEYDATIAFLATDYQEKTHVQLTHLSRGDWMAPETIYTSRKNLDHLSLAADLFGKKFVSWINTSDETIQVLEKLSRSWKISLVSPANADFPCYLEPQSDGSYMLAWMTPQNSLQTALYTEGWDFLDEIPMDTDVLTFMLTEAEDAAMLVWILDTDDLKAEMALFNGQSWDRINLEELLIIDDSHDF